MRKREGEPNQGEMIELTKNGEIIQLKADEYKRRLREPNRVKREDVLDSWYKFAIANALVENTEVFLEAVKRELEEISPVDEEIFSNAWRTIRDYATTGGANTIKSRRFGAEQQQDDTQIGNIADVDPKIDKK